MTFTLVIALASYAAAPSQAATTFITNDTVGKILASDESDAAALDGNGATDATTLSLSSDDGGGDITITTVALTGSSSLGMDADSMGNGNDKWGSGQSWTFDLDQEIAFDAISMFTFGENMTLQSSAWIGDANTTGSGWTFDGTTGRFTLLGSAGPTVTFDFTSAGVSNVAAGTDIFFGFLAGATGGEQMASFTISVIPPVPEPSSVVLVGLGGLFLLLRRRRR
ncbi:MAG: PEP-CTERM sorting domain-containing protein [Pirellulales bacterium]|nr:PEP-CTERM sorting domain-containing protein [Pirellulales bacterium]